MSRIVALLANDETANTVIEDLSELEDNDLDWKLVRPEADIERLIPAMPATAESDSLTPIGYVTENEMPDSVRVQDFDLDRDEEEFFAQGLEHGGTVLVVDMPRRFRAAGGANS